MEEEKYIPDNQVTKIPDRDKTNSFGIACAISKLPECKEVLDSHFTVTGLRKVIRWSDGKHYEILINPI